MLLLLSSILFAISANLDTLLIGIGYGIRGYSIKLWQNMLISSITLLGTFFSLAASTLLLPYFPAWLAYLFGSGILFLMGLYYIVKYFYRLRLAQNSLPDPETPSTLSLFLVGITLSVNNMGMGISAGFAGLPLLPALIATFVCSSGFLSLGSRLGRCKFLKLTADISDLISGLLLVGLSLFTILAV